MEPVRTGEKVYSVKLVGPGGKAVWAKFSQEQLQDFVQELYLMLDSQRPESAYFPTQGTPFSGIDYPVDHLGSEP